MMGRILLSIKDTLIKYFEEKQSLPSFGDLHDKEVKELAKRLKGKSTKETLNNILEWQHRNIQYWTERWYLTSLLQFIIIILIFISIFCLTCIFLTSNLSIPSTYSIILSLIISLIIILIIILKVTDIIILTIIYFISFFLIKGIPLKNFQDSPKEVLWLLDVSSLDRIICGIILFSLLYLSFIYKPFARDEKCWNYKIGKIIKMIIATFKLPLSVQEILEYKMGVCRDYAKLTAVLYIIFFRKKKFTLLHSLDMLHAV